MKITKQALESGLIVHTGWNLSRDVEEQCGVNVVDFFDVSGKYLGADCNGLEPEFEKVPIELHGKQVAEIKIYWDVQDPSNEAWAYTVYGDDCVLASGSVDVDADASLDDVIDEALFEIGIVGITHDDFGKSSDNGGYASWGV